MAVAPEPVTWDQALALAVEAAGNVLLLGAVDSGKTTFCLQAANAAVAAGRPVAVVDTDVGQGELGPPGTMGMLRQEETLESYRDVRVRSLAFVGDTSPVGHLLPVTMGASRLLRKAVTREAELVLVDTDGMVAGRLAEKLKWALAEAVSPALIVGLQRRDELARLLRVLGGDEERRIIVAPPSVRASRKPTGLRRSLRSARLYHYFQGARLLDVDAGQATMVDAWPFTGKELPEHLQRFASQALAADVLHGEESADGIAFCVRGRVSREGIPLLQEQFPRRRITLTPDYVFQNLMVGLVGGGGDAVEIGLLQGINFERGLLSILTPARSPANYDQVWFGRFRARPDGSEIGRLRPGDL